MMTIEWMDYLAVAAMATAVMLAAIEWVHEPTVPSETDGHQCDEMGNE